MNEIDSIIGSSLVTLVVAFGFLPQNFGKWQGPMNDGFTQMNAASVVRTIIDGHDIQTLLTV